VNLPVGCCSTPASVQSADRGIVRTGLPADLPDLVRSLPTKQGTAPRRRKPFRLDCLQVNQASSDCILSVLGSEANDSKCKYFANHKFLL
jgi:hypothetical protein